MRASRLLSILMMLQTRDRVTAEALAAEFEVSVRTIYRDIEQLSAADVPVYADRGPNGGFQLLDGYRTKLTGLSPAEAETLFLAGLPGPAAELGIADVLTTAQLKLTAALPERARATANRVAARFHLDPVGWFRSAGEAQLLPAIAHAVWDERCLDVRYQGRTGTAIHKLQPLGLVLKAGIWYLVAGGSDRPRTYRVSNILEITVRDERFERPKDFDFVRFWTLSSRAYEVGLYRCEAVLRVSPSGMSKLDLLGSVVARSAAETAVPPDPDGWVRVVIPIESIEQAAAALIGLGTDVFVLDPPELRRRIAANAGALSALYARRKPKASAERPSPDFSYRV